MTELETRACDFAHKRHEGQSYGSQPYTAHLAMVARIADCMGLTPEQKAAAWLHDTVEDTPTTVAELEAEFGANVARMVAAVTGVGPNRAARQSHIVAALAAVPEAIDVKLADRLANVIAATQDGRDALVAMYRSELALYAGVFARAHLPTYKRLFELLV